MKLDKPTSFHAFRLDDQIYDLSHLDAHCVEYQHIQPATEKHSEKITTYKFYVTYSMHCFTKDYPEQTEQEKKRLMYHTQRESRPFCKIRYALSKRYLADIIRQLPQLHIGFAGYDNFATVKILDEESQQALYYKVTFVTYRFEKKLRLHITSAYPINQWEKLKPVGFFRIAHNLLRNKPLPKP